MIPSQNSLLYNTLFLLSVAAALGGPFLWKGEPVFPYVWGISFLVLIWALYRSRQVRRLENECALEEEKIREACNLLEAALRDKTLFKNRLPSNIDTMTSLERLLEKLNTVRNSESLPVYVLDHLRTLFPRCSNILFFKRDEGASTLALAESNRQNRMVSLQEKNGDIFDRWVVRYNKSLLVENLEEEFRFPVAEALGPRTREIRSFISSPLAFGTTVLGAVRVESPRKAFFDLSDLRVLCAVCDIAAIIMERLVMMRKVADLAIRDGLTGLYLRDHFTKRLREEVAGAFLLKEQVSLLMIDIDNFKVINDTYGHAVGDAVLKQVAETLGRILLREGNFACRFGGEEFIAFLRTSKDDALRLAENVRAQIAHTQLRFRNRDVAVTVSIGAVSYPDDALSVEDLVFTADMFMYRAKQAGKNQVCSL